MRQNDFVFASLCTASPTSPEDGQGPGCDRIPPRSAVSDARASPWGVRRRKVGTLRGTPRASKAEHETSRKRPLVLSCGCPGCETVVAAGRLGSGSLLPGLQSAHAGSTQGTSHVHPVVRVRGRCQLTQHHADMSRSQASPQTLRLALGEAHRLPSKCGDKNLLLATHWPPWVWWLSWGQMELRIGYPQLRWLAMLSEPPHVH